MEKEIKYPEIITIPTLDEDEEYDYWLERDEEQFLEDMNNFFENNY